MPCKACGANADLDVCLNCGHRFCANHRGESGGATTCTPCLKEEAERARRVKERSAQRQQQREELNKPAVPIQVKPAEPAPLPEPKSGVKPILFGLGAALPTAGYLWWLGGTLVADSAWPSTTPHALAAGGAVFAFFGVWAIVKSRS